tara:strand:+ start:304 stop:567 length:264 start_codon:yes stop_codon:yes gene_type:complete
MSHYDNYMYCICQKAKFAERASRGYPKGYVSKDGEWMIGHKGDQDMHDWIDLDVDELPQWLQDFGMTNCCLSHEIVEGILSSPEWSK